MWDRGAAQALSTALTAQARFAPEHARRDRDTILSAGGSKDAADLVSDFLGRPYNIEAFSTWLHESPAG